MKNLHVNGKTIEVSEISEIGKTSVTYKTNDSKGWVVEFYADGQPAYVVEVNEIDANKVKRGTKFQVIGSPVNGKTVLEVIQVTKTLVKFKGWGTRYRRETLGKFTNWLKVIEY